MREMPSLSCEALSRKETQNGCGGWTRSSRSPAVTLKLVFLPHDYISWSDRQTDAPTDAQLIICLYRVKMVFA